LKVKRETIVVAGLTCLLYIGAILVGLGVHHMTFFPRPAQASRKMDWVVPRFDQIPADAHGDSIRQGALLFNDTFVYAPQYARAHVSCTSCHAEGGVQPYASPMVGLSAVFPTYWNARLFLYQLRSDRTGTRGVFDGTREEAYSGADREPVAAG